MPRGLREMNRVRCSVPAHLEGINFPCWILWLSCDAYSTYSTCSCCKSSGKPTSVCSSQRGQKSCEGALKLTHLPVAVEGAAGTAGGVATIVVVRVCADEAEEDDS